MYVDIRVQQNFNYYHTVGFVNYLDRKLKGQVTFFDGAWDQINPVYYQEVDKRVGYAHNAGLTTSVLCSWADQGFGDHSTTAITRLARYIVARYTAYNVIWFGTGEYDEAGSTTQYAAFRDAL